jgi:hypothetical protein
MDPSTLISAAKTPFTISKFIAGDGLREAISTIVGDINLKAAEHAYNKAQISNNQEARINSIITHLEAAHAAYAAVHEKATHELRREAVSYNVIGYACSSDVRACCIMALCHAHLGDYQSASYSLMLADKAWEHDRLYVVYWGTASFGGAGYPLSGNFAMRRVKSVAAFPFMIVGHVRQLSAPSRKKWLLPIISSKKIG